MRVGGWPAVVSLVAARSYGFDSRASTFDLSLFLYFCTIVSNMSLFLAEARWPMNSKVKLIVSCVEESVDTQQNRNHKVSF